MTFDGFPAEGFTFYERLEADNSKSFWNAHKADYQRFVREPLELLADELEPEFGQAILFRPYRDTRFSADKSLYKTHQGMFAERLPGTGYYLQVSADGLIAGGGFHSHAPDQVERYRVAADVEASGAALAAIVADLATAGLAIGGDKLKTRPCGVRPDHPRLELLRHRSLTATKDWPAGPPLHDRDALGLVTQTWRQLTPLCDWVREHVGGPQSTRSD